MENIIVGNEESEESPPRSVEPNSTPNPKTSHRNPAGSIFSNLPSSPVDLHVYTRIILRYKHSPRVPTSWGFPPHPVSSLLCLQGLGVLYHGLSVFCFRGMRRFAALCHSNDTQNIIPPAEAPNGCLKSYFGSTPFFSRGRAGTEGVYSRQMSQKGCLHNGEGVLRMTSLFACARTPRVQTIF